MPETKQKLTKFTEHLVLEEECVEALHQLVAHGALQPAPESPTMTIGYDDAKHQYDIDGVIVPSVTQVLDATQPKPALNWWHFRVGLAAVVRGVQEHGLSYGLVTASDALNILSPQPGHPDSVLRGRGANAKWKSKLEKACQDFKVDPYNVTSTKGDIGSAVHDAAERLAKGTPLLIDLYPESTQGYVAALDRYWLEQEPEIAETDAGPQLELIVASKRFMYAGRFDKVVEKKGKLIMRDYKTSGGIYGEMDMQLGGYDIAWHEMGHPPIDGHELVHLQPDGNYTLVQATPRPQDFLLALASFHNGKAREKRIRELGR